MPGSSARRPARGRSPAAVPSELGTVCEDAPPGAPTGDAADAATAARRPIPRTCPIPEPRSTLEPELFGEMRGVAEELPAREEDCSVIRQFVMGMETVAYARKKYPTARTAQLRASIAESTRALHHMIHAWLKGAPEPLEPRVVGLGAVRFDPDAAREAWLALLQEFRADRDPFHRTIHEQLRAPAPADEDVAVGDKVAAPPFHTLAPFARAVERQRASGAPSPDMIAAAIKAAAEDLPGLAMAAVEDAAKSAALGRARQRQAPSEGFVGKDEADPAPRGRRPRCVLPAPRACPLVKDVFSKAVKAKLADARREARFDVVFVSTPPGLPAGADPEKYVAGLPVASQSMHRLALLIMFQRAAVDHVERRRMHHARKGYAKVEAAQGALFEYMKRNRLQRQRLNIRARSSTGGAGFRPVDIVVAAQVGSMLPQRPALRMRWAWSALDELMAESADVFGAPLTRDSVPALAGAVASRAEGLGTRMARGFEDVLDEYYMSRDDRLVGIFGADALEAAATPAHAGPGPEGEGGDEGPDARAETRTSRATARSRAANSLIGVPGVRPLCAVPVVLRLLDVKPRARPPPRDPPDASKRRARTSPLREWDAPFSW